ncbi:polyphosphate kinase 2 family protein [Spirulina subsalsa FACHB-351]|uniref:Polyphosphate kinase 2 family protein n=1 Tax=Spirulina subsalsa FACHB-351 TaxID=234711 RepID=A0ABT3L3R0_9CYAN|nr:polyphosphate kinase 2 family protein [Spirulina subsalsa]MCW6035817.1 polyphosphate kinase 2 family protein [Spirulina subsalsa FACHB-351]
MKKTQIPSFIVPPNTTVSLSKDYRTDFTPPGLKKREGRALLAQIVEKLSDLQGRLYAQDTYGVLILFQALDAAGKDSTIKHVMSGINPQGFQVFSFKQPSAEELDHDYLWRYFKALPERGRIGIFNRSYYEDVLVTRVHPELIEKQKLPPLAKGDGIWERRFRQINNFEQYLVENGIVVIKFFLYVSKEEQKRRFFRRIERKDKNWKFSENDVKERAYWDSYIYAYEEVFNYTSTEFAPWHIIPADHKWFSRLTVGQIIYNYLARLDLHYPVVTEEHKKHIAHAQKMLEQEPD